MAATVDLKSFRMALQIAGIQATEEVVWLIGHLYEEVREKGDKFTIADADRVKELVRHTMPKPQAQ